MLYVNAKRLNNASGSRNKLVDMHGVACSVCPKGWDDTRETNGMDVA